MRSAQGTWCGSTGCRRRCGSDPGRWGGGRIAALLAALGLAVSGSAAAYRDLAACPDLLPRNPAGVADRAERACRRAVLREGRRYVRGALRSASECLGRFQRGALSGDPVAVCRGTESLSTGARTPPSDATAAAALAAAESGARAGIEAACSDAAAAGLGLCADTAAGLGACVVADHFRHVQHALDPQVGELAAAPGAPAARCQDAIAIASRLHLAAVQRATAVCLRVLGDTAAPGDLARRCVGEVSGGAHVPPRDPITASRLARAERRLRRHLARRCGPAELTVLDACAGDPAALGDCLRCAQRREAMWLIDAEVGGTAERATTHFVDWAALANPILERPDAMLKDQAAVYDADTGWFYVFSSTRFEPDDPDAATKERWFHRTRDFQSYETFLDPDLNPPGQGVGSPDVRRIDGLWHMTFQRRPPGSPDPDLRQLFVSTSDDLVDWSAPAPLAPDLRPDEAIIDGALGERDGFVYLGFKRREPVIQELHVTRSTTPGLDGSWLPSRLAAAGPSVLEDPLQSFAENYQFLEIDGRIRMLATSRDPESLIAPFRCGVPEYFIFTCSHEPFLYSIDGDGTSLDDWTRWTHKTQLRVPYEDWNPVMHANSAFLADWRAHDGFFYLFYAGSLDGDRFEMRGHGKIGVARSRDLVHWRVPGDLRD